MVSARPWRPDQIILLQVHQVQPQIVDTTHEEVRKFQVTQNRQIKY